MKLFVMVFGLFITAIGILGMAAPAVLLELGRSLLTPIGIYVIALIRVCLGLLLVWVAPSSRAPTTLRIIGALAVVAGLITPVFGWERSLLVLDWWSNQGAVFMQIAMGLAIIFGLFLTYAVAPRRRAPA